MMSPPLSSRANLTTEGAILTIHLPPSGLARSWSQGPVCLLLLLWMTVLTVGSALLIRADGWLERLVGSILLVLCAIVIRPLVLFVVRHYFVCVLGRGTIVAGTGRLYVHERPFLLAREHVWEAGAIVCLDEEEGALCVLSGGRLVPLFAGRDPEELRWIAEVLRTHLHVGADPPGFAGEIVVRYFMSAWTDRRRGFLLLEPGRFRLRPRFRASEGLVLQPGPHAEGVFSLTAGTLGIEPDDVRWGIAQGGESVLRIRLHVPDEDEPIVLELTCDRPADLREGMARFWREEGW